MNAFDTQDELISQEGYDKLKGELDAAKKERIEIAKKLEFAKSLGDLSENAEYAQAKEEHAVNESRIRYLEDYLSRAKIHTKLAKQDVVGLGSTIIVKGIDGEETYTIVGTHEVDITKGKISQESPFGKAFVGKKKGEKTRIKVPSGELDYAIISIS